jgi:hypothetical protein
MTKSLMVDRPNASPASDGRRWIDKSTKAHMGRPDDESQVLPESSLVSERSASLVAEHLATMSWADPSESIRLAVTIKESTDGLPALSLRPALRFLRSVFATSLQKQLLVCGM